MRKTISFHNYFLRFTFYKLEGTEGLDSILPNGKHILMWDFDNCNLDTVKASLKSVQDKYNLPDIHIYADNKPNSFRASSPQQVEFNQLLHILLDTSNIDRHYIEWTLKKGYATMRIGKKKGRSDIKLVDILINNNNISDYPQEMNFEKYKVIV